jgi:hypothetical protein
MPLSDRFDDALVYAARLHRDQIRKGSGIPYVSHLLAVCALVIEHGGSEDQAIAALLHDAAEDQGGEARLNDIRARYGAAVADTVADCTDAWTEPKPPWRPRKEAYLAALPSKPPTSLLVSLADKTHNECAILGDYRISGGRPWDRSRNTTRPLEGSSEPTQGCYRNWAKPEESGDPSGRPACLLPPELIRRRSPSDKGGDRLRTS